MDPALQGNGELRVSPVSLCISLSADQLENGKKVTVVCVSVGDKPSAAPDAVPIPRRRDMLRRNDPVNTRDEEAMEIDGENVSSETAFFFFKFLPFYRF
jgi:hypothetical protein